MSELFPPFPCPIEYTFIRHGGLCLFFSSGPRGVFVWGGGAAQYSGGQMVAGNLSYNALAVWPCQRTRPLWAPMTRSDLLGGGLARHGKAWALGFCHWVTVTTLGQIILAKLQFTPLLNGDDDNPNDVIGILEALNEIIEGAWFVLWSTLTPNKW